MVLLLLVLPEVLMVLLLLVLPEVLLHLGLLEVLMALLLPVLLQYLLLKNSMNYMYLSHYCFQHLLLKMTQKIR
jgi:hypothetical protein